jgi:hypothetical protein
MTQRLLFAIGLAAVLSTASLGRDIYVDNLTGDDRNNGSQLAAGAEFAGPLRTIKRALWIAHAGDRVILAKTAEPYREMICMIGPRNSGFEEVPFVIEGNGAVIDGSALINSEDWDHAFGEVYTVRFRYMAHPLLMVGDKPLPRMKVTGANDLSNLQPGEWASFGGKVYFRAAADRMLFTYPLAGASMATGLTLFQVSNVQIRNLTIQGFRIDGVSAPDAAEGVLLEKVVSRANGRSGLSTGGTSKVIALESQMIENGTAPVRMEGYCKLKLAGCVLSPITTVDRKGGVLMQE